MMLRKLTFNKSAVLFYCLLLSKSLFSHPQNSFCHSIEILDNPELKTLNLFNNMHYTIADRISYDDFYQLPCKTRRAPSLRFIKSYFETKKEEEINDEIVINGILLKNDKPSLIKAFKLLTTAENSKKQKKFSINSECQKVECAVSEIWGDELGLKLLYVADRFKIPASEYVSGEDSRERWGPNSLLEEILIALEDLPQSFYNNLPDKGKPKQISLYRSHIRPEDSNIIANSSISFYQAGATDSKHNQVNFIHELGHNLDHIQDFSFSSEWKNLKQEKPSVSEYSQQNTLEEFAEDIAAYRYLPNILSPEKYHFLQKNVFKKLEFTSDEKCLDLDKKRLEKIADILVSQKKSEKSKILDSITKQCVIIKQIALLKVKNSQKILNKCVDRELSYQKNQWSEEEIMELMKEHDIPFHHINYETIIKYVKEKEKKQYQDLQSSQSNKENIENYIIHAQEDALRFFSEINSKEAMRKSENNGEVCYEKYDKELNQSYLCSKCIVPEICANACFSEKWSLMILCGEIINGKSNVRIKDLKNHFKTI